MIKIYRKATVKVIVFLIFLILFTVPFSTISYGKSLKEYETSTGEEMIIAIKDAMLERESKFVIYYNGDYEDVEAWIEYEDLSLLVYDIFNSDDPNTSDDADYLEFSYNCEEGITCWIQGGYDNLVFKFETSYYTLKEEERYVNEKVADILDKLNLDGKTSYEKIKIIYDYIINNVEYDKNEDYNYLKMYSAYAGLADGKMVCNGYALLLYKMLTDSGVECKIISGMSYGEAHAWNIVKIGDYWYNLDVTWDDPGGNKFSDYKYFLKSNDDFLNHKRDKEYNTKSFNKRIPMSATSYEVPNESIILNKTKATIKAGEKITLKASPSIDTKVSWKSSNNQIAKVSKNGTVIGLEQGKVTITAKTLNGITATCVITVK